jgi:adenylylsulfate kinase
MDVTINTHNQKPFVLWFTGLSGAGKSTLADAVNKILLQHNQTTCLLDGDILRQGLCSDLGFSDNDRTENIRRAAELAKSKLESGHIVLAALISPKHSHRQYVRELLKEGQFIEVFVDTAFAECERRDTKGLYQKARSGALKNFTGISSEYGIPISPDINIKTQHHSIDQCVNQIFSYLYTKKLCNDSISSSPMNYI